MTGTIAIVICLLATIFPAVYAAMLRPADGLRARVDPSLLARAVLTAQRAQRTRTGWRLAIQANRTISLAQERKCCCSGFLRPSLTESTPERYPVASGIQCSFVQVTPIGKVDTHLYCVEADSWQKALQGAREIRKEDAPINGFSIELTKMDAGPSIRIRDFATSEEGPRQCEADRRDRQPIGPPRPGDSVGSGTIGFGSTGGRLHVERLERLGS